VSSLQIFSQYHGKSSLDDKHNLLGDLKKKYNLDFPEIKNCIHPNSILKIFEPHIFKKHF